MHDHDDADTQRCYHTDIGLIGWDRASEAAQALVAGHGRPDELRVLSALFARALSPGHLQRTYAGVFDGVRGAQLIARLRDRPEPLDIDALWALLFALFDRR